MTKHKCVTCSVSMDRLSEDYEGEEICRECEKKAIKDVHKVTGKGYLDWFTSCSLEVYKPSRGYLKTSFLLGLAVGAWIYFLVQLINLK